MLQLLPKQKHLLVSVSQMWWFHVFLCSILQKTEYLSGQAEEKSRESGEIFRRFSSPNDDLVRQDSYQII